MGIGDITPTVIGNLTSDPELRATPSGIFVANFTVASTPRSLDRKTNEWRDGETVFLRCTVWRDVAEHVAETLQRGSRVILTGNLRSRSYTTKEGEQRNTLEMDVEEIGASLRYVTAKLTKTERASGNVGATHTSGADPWATGPSSGDAPY